MYVRAGPDLCWRCPGPWRGSISCPYSCGCRRLSFIETNKSSSTAVPGTFPRLIDLHAEGPVYVVVRLWSPVTWWTETRKARNQNCGQHVWYMITMEQESRRPTTWVWKEYDQWHDQHFIRPMSTESCFLIWREASWYVDSAHHAASRTSLAVWPWSSGPLCVVFISMQQGKQNVVDHNQQVRLTNRYWAERLLKPWDEKNTDHLYETRTGGLAVWHIRSFQHA